MKSTIPKSKMVLNVGAERCHCSNSIVLVKESNGSLPPVRSSNSRHMDTDYSNSNGSNGRVRVEVCLTMGFKGQIGSVFPEKYLSFSFLSQVSTDDKVRRLENTYFNELKELRVSFFSLS